MLELDAAVEPDPVVEPVKPGVPADPGGVPT
jgi:hypothetical protein